SFGRRSDGAELPPTQPGGPPRLPPIVGRVRAAGEYGVVGAVERRLRDLARPVPPSRVSVTVGGRPDRSRGEGDGPGIPRGDAGAADADRPGAGRKRSALRGAGEPGAETGPAARRADGRCRGGVRAIRGFGKGCA